METSLKYIPSHDSHFIESHSRRLIVDCIDCYILLLGYSPDTSNIQNFLQITNLSEYRIDRTKYPTNTATAQELFNSCAAHGGKAWDHSAMVRALEKLANFEIGQTSA